MDFKVFLEGAKAIEEVTYVASKRYTDKGKPVEWKLKPINSGLDDALRKSCTRKVPITGKRGQFTMELDNDAYIAKMCVETIVEPNLKDAEFQNAFGVMSGEDLLHKLLLSGEYTDLKNKVLEVNGYDMDMDELVEEAKN